MIYGEVFADQIDRKQVYDSHTPKSGTKLWSGDVLQDCLYVFNKWLGVEDSFITEDAHKKAISSGY